MSTARAAFFLFIGVTSLCHAGTAQLPPTPSDPKLAEAFMGAQTLQDQARTLEMPASPQAWPCEVSDLQMRTLGHVLNEDEMTDKIKLAFRKASMNAGMSSKDSKFLYKDARFAPLAANCKNGLLDGPLEFLVEYTRVIESPASTMEMRMRVKKSMLVAAGEEVMEQPERTSILQVSSKTTYKDPKMQAAMAKIKMPEIKGVTGTYIIPLNADDAYVATIIDLGAAGGGQMTMLQRPTAPKRAEMTTYRGADFASVMYLKNGLPHGEQRTAAQTVGNYTSPESRVCYEDGEIIKTTKCDVE